MDYFKAIRTTSLSFSFSDAKHGSVPRADSDQGRYFV